MLSNSLPPNPWNDGMQLHTVLLNDMKASNTTLKLWKAAIEFNRWPEEHHGFETCALQPGSQSWMMSHQFQLLI